MSYAQTISPDEIYQTIAANEISKPELKDGTILKINPNLKGKDNQKMNGQERHNHHQDGIGSFGQHFKTEYSSVCPGCISGPGAIIKKRQNYVLYVSKNVTEANISKNKDKCNNPAQQQGIYGSGNLNIVPKKRKIIPKKGGNGGRIISQGYVDYNQVPVLEPKIKLRNEQNAYGYNLCPDCVIEEEGNEEKVTTTVQVLVPENQ